MAIRRRRKAPGPATVLPSPGPAVRYVL